MLVSSIEETSAEKSAHQTRKRDRSGRQQDRTGREQVRVQQSGYANRAAKRKKQEAASAVAAALVELAAVDAPAMSVAMRKMLNLKEKAQGRPCAQDDHRFDDFAGLQPQTSAATRETVSDVMLCMIKYCRTHRLWCVGEPLVDSKGDLPRAAFLTLDGQRRAINPEFCSALAIADTRLTDSFEEYYLPQPSHAVTRSNETNGRFRTLSALSKDAVLTQKFFWAREYCSDPAYLLSKESQQGNFRCLTNDAIVIRLRAYTTKYHGAAWAASLLNEAGIKQLCKVRPKRDALVNELCRVRRLICTAAPAGGGETFPPMPCAKEPADWRTMSRSVLSHRFFSTKAWKPEEAVEEEETSDTHTN